MITPLIGILMIVGVLVAALSARSGGPISFFDVHAGIVVFGGVLGALLIAIDAGSLMRMLKSLRELLPSASLLSRELFESKKGLEEIKAAWLAKQRGAVLGFADGGKTEELRATADMLLRRVSKSELREGFTNLRTSYMHRILPVIEGWELVGKLAPSFGMVGTVTGMVQLFRNMGHNTDIGGAMAMALLATLYGIALGATVGGPMASRVNKQFNDRMALLDMMEQTTLALLTESKKGGQ
ncbi:MAG: MotA/TolQ/ExbB proton channel family protein [Oligoflexales bacterium]